MVKTVYSAAKFRLQGDSNDFNYNSQADILRFAVDGDTRWVKDPSYKNRTELTTSDGFVFGKTYTINYDFMIEPGAKNSSDWVKFNQIHQYEDAGDGSLAPVFDLGISGEKLRIVSRADADPITATDADATKTTLFQGEDNLVRGEWYSIKIQFVLNPYSNGQVDVWLNGEQIVDYSGPVGYNDAGNPYWKMGIYRAVTPEALGVNFRGFTMDVPTSAEKNAVPAGTIGDDYIHGGSGADKINGGLGDDMLRGGSGNDIIVGGDGADWLAGDKGVDTLTGGKGADIFYHSVGMGIDTVTDFNAYEGDRVQLDKAEIYSITDRAFGTVIDLGAGDQLVLTGVHNFSYDWIVN